MESKFTGKLLGLIGINLLSGLLSLLILFFGILVGYVGYGLLDMIFPAWEGVFFGRMSFEDILYIIVLLLYGCIFLIPCILSAPFAFCCTYCIKKSWNVRHTVIDGYELVFDGNAIQLLGKVLVWLLLTIVTLGIYSWWIVIKLKQWGMEHTHLVEF